MAEPLDRRDGRNSRRGAAAGYGRFSSTRANHTALGCEGRGGYRSSGGNTG